jgi:hypothetical protein
MLPAEDLSRLEAFEQATTSLLTLTEGLEREELARSRLTRLEVRRFLLDATLAIEGLSLEAQAALPELDRAAWQTTRQRLNAGDAVESDLGWLAIQGLAPTTLGWVRFYRRQQPELFAQASS